MFPLYLWNISSLQAKAENWNNKKIQYVSFIFMKYIKPAEKVKNWNNEKIQYVSFILQKYIQPTLRSMVTKITNSSFDARVFVYFSCLVCLRYLLLLLYLCPPRHSEWWNKAASVRFVFTVRAHICICCSIECICVNICICVHLAILVAQIGQA